MRGGSLDLGILLPFGPCERRLHRERDGRGVDELDLGPTVLDPAVVRESDDHPIGPVGGDIDVAVTEGLGPVIRDPVAERLDPPIPDDGVPRRTAVRRIVDLVNYSDCKQRPKRNHGLHGYARMKLACAVALHIRGLAAVDGSFDMAFLSVKSV